MKITDEKLSAFLDAELAENEMAEIRQQIADDEQIAMRLAELSMVDEQIRATYSQIDDQPLPQGLNDLLAQPSAATQAESNVVEMASWKKPVKQLSQFLSEHAAQAASVALVAGVMLGVFSQTQTSLPTTTDNWQQQAAVLENSISGNAFSLDDGSTLTPELTFINYSQQVCRQYKVSSSAGEISKHIACKGGDNWQKVASFYPETVSNEYQAASGTASSNNVSAEQLMQQSIDAMISSDFLMPQQEQSLKQNKWQVK